MSRLPSRLLPLALAALFAAACSGDGPVASTPVTDPDDVEWDPLALEQLVIFMDSTNASAFVLMYEGEIVAEHYPANMDIRELTEAQRTEWEGLRQSPTADGLPVEDVLDLQNGVLGLLSGMAVDRGLISLDATVTDVLGAGWSRAPAQEEAQVLVRHILSGTSGLNADLERQAAPGTVWGDDPAVFALMQRVLEASTGLTLEVMTNDWFGEDLGMEVAEWIEPTDDRGYLGFATSARDLGLVGQLILNRGSFDGETLIQASSLNEVLRSSQQVNPSYGQGWWVNGQATHIRSDGTAMKGAVLPTAPSDLVYTYGAHDRFLAVIPSRDVVVVRLGPWYQPGRFIDAFSDFWALITESAPR